MRGTKSALSVRPPLSNPTTTAHSQYAACLTTTPLTAAPLSYLSTRLRYSTVLSGLGGDQLCQAKSMVVLPTVSPVPVAEGCWMSTKDAAKASACVAAIRLLHQVHDCYQCW